MLLLVCLFFVAFAYTAENTPLLSVIVEDDCIVQDDCSTKAKYYEDAQEYWNFKKIYFYNLATETVQSFEPNDEITNLFSKLNNLPLPTIITQLPKMKSILQKHKLHPDLRNKFDLLFKSINELSFSDNQYFKKQFLYHVKLFFYNIKLNQDSLIRALAYEDFLKSTEKCTSDAYDRDFQANKKVALGLNIFATILFGSFGISIPVILQDPSSISSPFFGGSILASYFMTGSFFLGRHFRYRRFLEIIENLKEKTQE